jgi:cytoskeletal protein CcmA (bactofilin family)
MKTVPRRSDSGGEHNRIVEGTQIQGNIHSPGDIRIDGHVKGNLSVGGKLVVGPTGAVDGEMRAQEASIAGRVLGKLEIKGLTTLTHTANVLADLNTGQLAVESGAQLTGSCVMANRKTTATPADTIQAKKDGASAA